MESQPQNPEFRNNPENFHPCTKSFFECTLVASKDARLVCVYLNLNKAQDKQNF